jgi:large subunit ribosomal protein L21
MFAVLKTGGKQYRISQGDILRTEKQKGKVGDHVTLEDVILISSGDQIQIGHPKLEKAVVVGEIVQQIKGRKILTYKMKKRKNYRRMKGHRQPYTYLRIKEIKLSSNEE